MKSKQKIDTVINSFLVSLGLLMIIAAVFNYSDVKTVFIAVMFFYAIFNLVQYIYTRKSNDYEGLYTFLASMTVGIIDIFFSFSTENVLPISLMAWVIMMSVIKFIKTDYYNDRKDKMWKLRIVLLLLFMLIGIVTSISLNYSDNVRVLILGYFFLIHGILELIDPITKYLIGK